MTADAKDRAAAILIDPSSPLFRNVQVMRRNDEVQVCGEINGKNGFGAYAGFVRFVAGHDDLFVDPGTNLGWDDYSRAYGSCLALNDDPSALSEAGYCPPAEEIAAAITANRVFKEAWSRRCGT